MHHCHSLRSISILLAAAALLLSFTLTLATVTVNGAAAVDSSVITANDDSSSAHTTVAATTPLNDQRSIVLLPPPTRLFKFHSPLSLANSPSQNISEATQPRKRRDRYGQKQGKSNLTALSLGFVIVSCIFCCLCVCSIAVQEEQKPEEGVTIITNHGEAVGLDALEKGCSRGGGGSSMEKDTNTTAIGEEQRRTAEQRFARDDAETGEERKQSTDAAALGVESTTAAPTSAADSGLLSIAPAGVQPALTEGHLGSSLLLHASEAASSMHDDIASHMHELERGEEWKEPLPRLPPHMLPQQLAHRTPPVSSLVPPHEHHLRRYEEFTPPPADESQQESGKSLSLQQPERGSHELPKTRDPTAAEEEIPYKPAVVIHSIQ